MKDDSDNRLLAVGHLVRSKAGRDKGHYYLVLGPADDDRSLLVVDGRKRGIRFPKKKNMLHLQMTNKVSQAFIQKIATAKSSLRDEEIRSYLAEFDIDQ